MCTPLGLPVNPAILLRCSGALLAEVGPLPPTTIAFHMQNARGADAEAAAAPTPSKAGRQGRAGAAALWMPMALRLLAGYLVADKVEVTAWPATAAWQQLRQSQTLPLPSGSQAQ